jgi:hypothetical protein
MSLSLSLQTCGSSATSVCRESVSGERDKTEQSDQFYMTKGEGESVQGSHEPRHANIFSACECGVTGANIENSAMKSE